MSSAAGVPRRQLLPGGLFLATLLAGLAGSHGQVTFTRITGGAIVTDGGSSSTCAWGDYDNDGFEDLFVANASASESNFLYRNNGDGTFAKMAGSAVSASGNSVGAGWGDYDNDGHLDLFVCNRGGTSRTRNYLYRNDGHGGFTRINTSPLATDFLFTLVSAWGDFDRDGYLDVVVGNHSGDGKVSYRNQGDGAFGRVDSGPMALNDGDVIGCAWGDYDNDGWPDLFVAGYFAVNRLYHNEGNGMFVRVTDGDVPNESGNFSGCAWGDYDNDGDLDLFVAKGGLRGIESNALYRNNGNGAFTRETEGGIVNDVGRHVGCAWGDYDNDGYLDLFVSQQSGRQNRLYHNNGDGTFTAVTDGDMVNDVSYSPNGAWADFDNDGFLDLFVANGAFTIGSYNNFLYRNDGNDNHWLKLKLVGGPSNRAAIGAKVRVNATISGASRWQMREISGGSGFGSQDSLIAHFGLGDATHVDTVRIEWPSGTVQELHDLAANQRLTITEPPRLSTPQVTAGTLQWTLAGARNLSYGIQVSSNLLNWADWTTVTITNANGRALITDNSAAGRPRRFYRATVGE
jgi:hypothetical protein